MLKNRVISYPVLLWHGFNSVLRTLCGVTTQAIPSMELGCSNRSSRLFPPRSVFVELLQTSVIVNLYFGNCCLSQKKQIFMVVPWGRFPHWSCLRVWLYPLKSLLVKLPQSVRVCLCSINTVISSLQQDEETSEQRSLSF